MLRISSSFLIRPARVTPRMMRSGLRRYSVAPIAENDLRKTLTGAMKDAMKSKDSVRTTTIRSVLSEVYNADKAQPSPLASSAITNIIRKAVSRRTDSAVEYEKASRPELAEKERKEANILEAFLPPLLSESEIERALREAITETGATPGDKRIFGQVFKTFYTKVDRSQVDPEVVKKTASALLSA